MSKRYKIRVTKCYLVQIIDEHEDEIGSEYVFAENQTEAKQHGKMLLRDLTEQESENT